MIALNTDLRNLGNPSPNFYTGSQKVQNVAFETLWFRNEATQLVVYTPVLRRR